MAIERFADEMRVAQINAPKNTEQPTAPLQRRCEVPPQNTGALNQNINRFAAAQNTAEPSPLNLLSGDQTQIQREFAANRIQSHLHTHRHDASSSAAQTTSTPTTDPTVTVLKQTKEVTITREAHPPSEPGDPTIDRMVIDAGAGNDRMQVTRDIKTGGLTVNVNGERHSFTAAEADMLTIRAGEGHDTVTVASNVRVNLTIEGGAGNDVIRGGAGNERIEAGAGNDTVYGGAGRDYVNGGAGDDRLYGGAGSDVIYGGSGNDTLAGQTGNDYLEGGTGNDRLFGHQGRDVLSGGIGDDALDGGTGDDRLYAGQGRDRLTGGAGRNTIYSQRDDTVTAAPRNSSDSVINVELTGTPGSRALRIEGSPEFVERVTADIEFLRSSPTGRRMLDGFDKAYDSTRSPLAALPIIGGAFNNGNTVTIRELKVEDNGYADWSRRTTGGPHPFLDASGNPGTSDDATISYNTQLNNIYDRNPPTAANEWKDIDPVVILYHEMAHSYNIVTGTFQDNDYVGTGPDSGVIPNSERQAVGLPNSGVLYDNDDNPATPASRDNPTGLTENALRREMGRPLRPTYGDS